MTDFAGDEWRGRVGNSWAAEWARTDRSFGGLTGHLLDAIDGALPQDSAGKRSRVLDIGCGAGETAIRLAGRRSNLDVTGLDLSDELVAVARARATGYDNVRFAQGDAAAWHGAAGFDLALSRHGVMFFGNPAAAFAHMRGLMRPGAPLVFTCFAERSANAWASELGALVGAPDPTDPYSPGPFAFADPAHVAAILAEAGWQNAKPQRIDFAYVAGGGPDPAADALSYFMRIGPMARHFSTLAPDIVVQLRPRVVDWISHYVAGGEARFPAAAWLWQATA